MWGGTEKDRGRADRYTGEGPGRFSEKPFQIRKNLKSLGEKKRPNIKTPSAKGLREEKSLPSKEKRGKGPAGPVGLGREGKGKKKHTLLREKGRKGVSGKRSNPGLTEREKEESILHLR